MKQHKGILLILSPVFLKVSSVIQTSKAEIFLDDLSYLIIGDFAFLIFLVPGAFDNLLYFTESS